MRQVLRLLSLNAFEKMTLFELVIGRPIKPPNIDERQLNGIVAGATEIHWAAFSLANMLGGDIMDWHVLGTGGLFWAQFARDIAVFYQHVALAVCVIMALLLLLLGWRLYRCHQTKP